MNSIISAEEARSITEVSRVEGLSISFMLILGAAKRGETSIKLSGITVEGETALSHLGYSVLAPDDDGYCLISWSV